MVTTRYPSGSELALPYMFGRDRLDKLDTDRPGILLIPGGVGQRGRRFLTFPSDWTWGNDEMIGRIDDALAQAQAEHAFAERVHLILVSMGGTGLNWSRQNPEKVASQTLIVPVVDQQDIYDNDLVAPYGTIQPPETAFGGNRPPDSHVPARNAEDFREIPTEIWYSNNDPVCRPQVIVPFAEAARARRHNLGNQYPAGWAIPGHAADNLPLQHVADFNASYDEQ